MAINFPNNPAVNDTFTVSGTKFTFTGVKWETGAVVDLSSDTTPTLGGDLDGGAKNINNVGVITATTFSGNLTGNAQGLTGDPSIQVTNATVLGDLDVQGTTTTIDTAITEVDSLNVEGFVGIGITNPDKKLVVKGSGGNYVSEFHNTQDAVNNNGVYIRKENTTASTETLNVQGAFIVNGDGNITSSGTVKTGTISTTTAGGAGSTLTGDGRLTLQFPSGGGGGVGMFSVYSGTSKNIELFSGGSATFAGAITAASFNGNLDASQLSSGTIPDARFPATLPAASGANLTDLPGMSTSSKTGAYTLVAGDNNSLIRTNSNITVPASVFSIADATTIYNNSSSSISIVQGGSVTLRLAGSNTTGTRTLAQRGVCTVMCVGTNEFIITGSGLA